MGATPITRDQYFMDQRDKKYPLDLTPEIERNVFRMVGLANQLLERFGEYRSVNSGWRPPSINANTPKASKTSLHMKGLAIDLNDDDGELDAWCMANLPVLVELGLWLEHPSATDRWCHVQAVPPGSGNRVFRP